MRVIETTQAQRTVVLDTSLELCPIEENLWAYRLRVTPTIEGQTKTSKSKFGDRFVQAQEETGLVDDAGRRALLRGRPAPEVQGAPEASLRRLGAQPLKLCALGRANIEAFRTGGWWGGPRPPAGMGVENNVFEAFAAPDSSWTADDVVFMDFHDERLYDRHGAPLPVAVRFDYVGSRLCESTHDLKAVKQVLSARADIRPLDPNLDQLEIMRIPGYNAEEGRTRSIEFVWMPTVEDYRLVAAAGQRPYGTMREAFFEVDIAGLAGTRLEPIADDTEQEDA